MVPGAAGPCQSQNLPAKAEVFTLPDLLVKGLRINCAWGLTSLAVQWLGLHASTAGGVGSIPGQGTEIPQAAWHGQKSKK